MEYMDNTIKKLHYGATITRLSLGIALLAYGLFTTLIVTVDHIPTRIDAIDTIEVESSIDLNLIIVYLIIFGEIVGGIALILGLYSRLVALLSLPILIGIAYTDIYNGWVFVALAITVIIQGSGSFAIRKLPFIDNFIPECLKG